MKLSVNIVSSGHMVNDDLILYRYALTLANAGINVKIFARSRILKEKIEGILCYRIMPLKIKGILRYLIGNIVLFIIFLFNKADVYIICTPDLLPTTFVLKYLSKKKIIYNAQENYKVKFLRVKWIPKFVCNLFILFENLLSNKMDGIIVTDSISAKNYQSHKVIILPNYPTLEIKENLNKSLLKLKESNEFNMVYIGSISKDRGLCIFKNLLDYLPENYFIHLYGRAETKDDMKIINNCNNIIYHGFIDHKKIKDEIKKYALGFDIFENLPSYRYIAENSTKLFEYMKAGLPVVTSNFPGLRKIVESSNCGITINPDNIEEAACLIENLSKDKIRLKQMGINSFNAFLTKYNWNYFKEKLVDYVIKVHNT